MTNPITDQNTQLTPIQLRVIDIKARIQKLKAGMNLVKKKMFIAALVKD